MMGFAETQTKLLAGKLDRRHVRTRELGERTVSYIEGWHAIVEANRIFGFDGWDRETVWAQCVWEEGRRERRRSRLEATPPPGCIRPGRAISRWPQAGRTSRT